MTPNQRKNVADLHRDTPGPRQSTPLPRIYDKVVSTSADPVLTRQNGELIIRENDQLKIENH